jgi:hypothetical protein
MRLVLTFVLAALSARAAIVVAFDQQNQRAQPGDLLHFTAVISNTGIDEVPLDFDQIPGLPPEFTINDFFFDNVPLSVLGHSDSGDILLFDVQVGAAAYGHYTGNYELFNNSVGPLTSQDFSIQVVPEPATFTLFAAAGLALYFRRR